MAASGCSTTAVRKGPWELRRKSPEHRASAGHPLLPPSENGAAKSCVPSTEVTFASCTKLKEAGLETPKQELKVGLCLVSLFFFLTFF